MLAIQYIKDNTEAVIEGLGKKHLKDDRLLVEQAISVDANRRATQNELDQVNAHANQNAKEIGGLMQQGKKNDAESLKKLTGDLKLRSKQLGETLENLEEELKSILVKIPNLPHSSVPVGRTPEDNLNVDQWGEVPNLYAGAAPHWELIKKYDIIDFELGNKITGAGFPVYKGKGARLQRAMINYFLDQAVAAGYMEIQPPILINEASGFGTGNLPDKEGQMYHSTVDNYYLIPTAEIPVTNIYRDTIQKESDLPIKNVAYTPCFRREAGSWGADVRGLNRLHQFDKVEIVQISTPEKSYELLEEMKAHVKKLLESLELPCRILKLCGGDMSFTSALTYDFEVFSAAQKRWLEVSSVSNFESFQANRLKLRYKKDNQTLLLHTLNGSALALPRILAALLENNQDENGISIPTVLVPYTGFDRIE
jgi:seryl-tRNA synthetase